MTSLFETLAQATKPEGTLTVTCDGKYKTYNNNGIVTVYRNNILWKTPKETAGDGYLLSLIQELEDKEGE